MKNKVPFYKNGFVIGLALLVVGAALSQQDNTNTTGALLALAGLIVIIVTPIKRLLDRRKAKAQADTASTLSADLNHLEVEIGKKNRQLAEKDAQILEKDIELASRDDQLRNRDSLLNQLKEELKPDAQKQIEQDYIRDSANLRQVQQELLEAQARRDALARQNSDAERKLDASKRKNEKYQALAAAMSHAYGLWYSGKESQAVAALESFGLDEMYSEPDLQCMTMKDLRTRYKNLRKRIDDTQTEFLVKCPDPAYKVIVRFMTYGMVAELEIILSKLGFGGLESAISSVKAMTDKYSATVRIAKLDLKPPIDGLIGQYEYLFFGIVETEYEYYVRRERAKEEQKALREQMKQEAEERKQLENERKKVEAEEKKYQLEMERIKQEMQSAHDAELESLKNRLAEMQSMMNKVEERKADIVNLQNGKAGTIYIISNIGSFGEGVFKVGMTRRLVPEDRINELSNASVPFPFDIHSFIFSEDAPALEAALHRELNNKRVNKVNLRKEFFRVSIEELQQLVERYDSTAPFKTTALAEQYRESLSITEVPDSLVEEVEDDDP